MTAGLRRILGILTLAAGLSGAGPVRADGGIAVIIGKSPPHIAFDRANLEDIFLKRIRVDDDRAALVPFNLSSTNPLRVAFSLALLGERPTGLQRYWTERYFHGVSPPYTVRSQESMLRFVAETPGAVGYVASCRVDGRVRVVARLAVPADLADRVQRLCVRSDKEPE